MEPSTYQKYSENYIYPPPLAGNWQTDNRLTLDFVYEIDFWNKNGAALDAALSQAQAAGADAQAARVVVTTGIARAYFNLQRLFAQRDVSRAAIVQRDEVVRITDQRFGAGLDTKVEVKQAEAALATVRTELAQYDEADRHRAQPVGCARRRRPRTRRIDRRGEGVRSTREHAAVGDSARSPRAPAGYRRVALARRGVAARHRRRQGALLSEREHRRVCRLLVDRPFQVSAVRAARSRGAGPAIHLPIFEGGRLNANLRGRDAEADLAVSTYNQAVIDAVHDVADAVASIAGLSHVATEQARAKQATTEAYDVAVIRYKAGLGNYLSVLTAQTQQLVQDRLDADLKARAFELDVNLARALGGGFVDNSAVNLSAAPAATTPR